MNATIHSRIADLLAERKSTMSDLARYIRVSPQAVQRWVAGDATPRGNNLSATASYLGTTPQFLLFGNNAEDEGSEQSHSTNAKPAAPPQNAGDLARTAMQLVDSAADENAILRIQHKKYVLVGFVVGLLQKGVNTPDVQELLPQLFELAEPTNGLNPNELDLLRLWRRSPQETKDKIIRDLKKPLSGFGKG